MGGPDAVMKLGREALQKGDYRWGAEVVNHLVFAQPENQEAKNLQADILNRWVIRRNPAFGAASI